MCEKANSEMLVTYAWRNIIRRSLIDENSIFYEENLSLGQETPFMLEILFVANSMVSVDEAFYYYVHRNDSKQGTIIKDNLLEKLKKVYLAKYLIYKKYNLEKLLPDLYRYTIDHYFVMLISQNNYAKASLSKKYQKTINTNKRESDDKR